MYDHFKCPFVRVRGCGKRSTNKAVRAKIMAKLAETFAEPEQHTSYLWLKLYGEWKSLEKLRSSYVDNLAPTIDEHGRIHPEFLVHGTEVGRLSARGPAVQTIPRPGTGEVGEEKWGAYIRGFFSASEGRVIIHADYSQAEMRVAACLSNDEFLLDLYHNDRDLHTEVAIAMYGEGFTKEQRVLCKMFNFSYLYGGNEFSFAQDSGLDINKAKAFVRKYDEVMKGLAAWKAEQLARLRKYGYVVTVTGRRRRVPLITNANLSDAAKAAVHAPVAGTASDLTLISLEEVYRWLNKVEKERTAELWKYGQPTIGPKVPTRPGNIIITVHDSILLDVYEEDVEYVGKNVKRIMEGVASSWFPQIPWKVEVDVGYSWGELEPLPLT